MIKAVVFDLDGTLLDTLADLANSCNYALEEMGLPPHPQDSYKYFVGKGKDNLIRNILGEHLTDETFQQADKLYSDHYAIHGEDCTCPYDGILAMLEKLKAAGIACAVVSNKPHSFCQVLVPQYFGDLLSPIFGHLAGTALKPDPHRVLQAMEELGVTPAQTLYVGDTNVDMETAKNSGLPAAGVLWGFRTRQELADSGATYLCNTPQELGELILSL